jgi:hypothetical protein
MEYKDISLEIIKDYFNPDTFKVSNRNMRLYTGMGEQIHLEK